MGRMPAPRRRKTGASSRHNRSGGRRNQVVGQRSARASDSVGGDLACRGLHHRADEIGRSLRMEDILRHGRTIAAWCWNSSTCADEGNHYLDVHAAPRATA